MVAGSLPHCFFDVGPSDAVGHFQVQIARHCRKNRQRTLLRDQIGCGAQNRQPQLGHGRAGSQLESLQSCRTDFAQVAQQLLGRGPGVESHSSQERAGSSSSCRVGRTEMRPCRFSARTSPSMTPLTARKSRPLVRASIRSSCGKLAGRGQIDLGRFEQLDLGIGQGFVGPPRAEQAGNQAPPQTIGPAQHRHRRPQGRRGGPGTERFGPLLVNDAQRERFVKPGGTQARRTASTPIVVGTMRRDHRHAGVFGNLVVAVNPRDFLDQVDLARQIAPPRGRNHLDQVDFGPQLAIAQCRQDLPRDVGRAHRCPGCAWSWA